MALIIQWFLARAGRPCYGRALRALGICGVIALLNLTGCGSTPTGTGADAVFIVTGVGGNSGYGPMVDALARPNRTVQVIAWGSPMFMMNFSTESVHDEAE